MPYDLFSLNKCNISLLQYYTQSHLLNLLLEKLFTLFALVSSSRPTRPSFFFLLHVASFLTEHWLLIFPAFWGAGPSLIPLPQADPISLRSQATPRSYVGHSKDLKGTVAAYVSGSLAFRCKRRLNQNKILLIFVFFQSLLQFYTVSTIFGAVNKTIALGF